MKVAKVNKFQLVSLSHLKVMRYACLVYAVPHATTDDVQIAGYNIPSGTTVYANMWRVMHGEDYWDDHDAFDPERFIDQETRAFRYIDNCSISVQVSACVFDFLS